ncbi:MAG: XdhC family protein [SAR324 cluster bacterium]|nr:XdhC family protein [SAR324 cluster bacterium]
MSHKELYQVIEDELRKGRAVAQATVIQTKGSTPRKAGSVMLVKSDGGLYGTIGGGCGEAGVIQKARLSLHDGKIREELADLTEDIAVESEGVCGGTFRVFIQPWQPGSDQLELVGRLKEYAGASHDVLVHHVVKAESHPDRLGSWIFQRADGSSLWPEPSPIDELSPPSKKKPVQLNSVGAYEVFTERWTPQPTLVIVGAGHIAEPLEEVGRILGFRTVVIDDRRLFANRERFPRAEQVICGPILDVVREISLDQHSYVVLVTRGHALDMDALKVMVERNDEVAYVGMIGSARRVKAVFQLMEADGYSREVLQHVRAPVGLSLGAETPAEIAVSIAAELVSVLHANGDDTRPMSKVSAVHPSLRGKI